MKPLVVIPARGGSKGVPKKNIKPLNGKPLIHYSIEAARQVFNDKDIIVSTDDPEIRAVAEQTGLHVPFLRPAEYATDTAGQHETLLHALEYKRSLGEDPDVLLILQPTSPLRTAEHIRGAMALYTSAIDMVVSVKETGANPYYLLFEENEQGYLEKSKKGTFLRRQDCPKVWEYNGALYVVNIASLESSLINHFEKVIKYEMSDYDSVDIDTVLDFQIAELVLNMKYKTSFHQQEITKRN